MAWTCPTCGDRWSESVEKCPHDQARQPGLPVPLTEAVVRQIVREVVREELAGHGVCRPLQRDGFDDPVPIIGHRYSIDARGWRQMRVDDAEAREAELLDELALIRKTWHEATRERLAGPGVDNRVPDFAAAYVQRLCESMDAVLGWIGPTSRSG